MNKLLIVLGLAAAVTLVGCSKEKAPETGATTGEHLENAAQQASHDMENAASEAAAKTEAAAKDVKDAAKDATAHVAGAVEQGAGDVKEKAQQ